MPDDRILSLTFSRPKYIPVSLGILPAAWVKYRGDLRAVAQRHPLLFNQWNTPPEGDYDNLAWMPWQSQYRAGTYTDAWGCVWTNQWAGHAAIVTGHPVPTRAEVHSLQLPTKDDGFPHGFMYLRLADLRGFEEVMTDFAEEAPELQLLIDKVLAHNLRQAEIANKDGRRAEPDIAYFGDDLGMQTSLAMGPCKWRKYLKPAFKAIFDRFHQNNRYVYLHTDGHIHEIIPDLIDCGVNVVNPQYRANGLDHLVRTCKGKVCVDLDLDRQLFPFANPRQIDDHIKGAVDALGSPEGGLWLKAEVDEGDSLEVIEAICYALERERERYASST